MGTVVMTGGTAGLGKVAAQRIAGAPDVRLVSGGRSGGAVPLDLARLASVREFAASVDAAEISALVLNAGTQFPTTAGRTEDGFETTFAVNHLAHYLLLRLLLPKLAPGATVVITTSDTHDPKSVPVISPRQLDIAEIARPRAGRFLAGFRAYATSKLCNLMTARALAAREPGLKVVAFNPGFTPGTALARNWPGPVRPLMAVTSAIAPLARFATVEQAGTDSGRGTTCA